jgi:phosphatidylinositol-3-phosphatase
VTARVLVALVALAVPIASVLAPLPASGAAAPAAAPIGHVFVINLENKSFAETWGAHSPMPYLSRTLRTRGVFLGRYYGVAHPSLPNYIAQVSGQGPSRQTQRDCPVYRNFATTGQGADGQVLGDGCVYPRSVRTIADQLTERGLTWKAYLEDLGRPCRHPRLGAADGAVTAHDGSAYATRHDPFVYFHSVVDAPDCGSHVVPLGGLVSDLASVDTTPDLSYITPNLCHDGHDATCPDGSPGGPAGADRWLREWVPRILGSPAFAKDGLLVVTFDEAEVSGRAADAAACCGELALPNVASASANPPGPGGGRIGAVLVSPFLAPGTRSDVRYDHYALLCSLEDFFGLDHLGYAGRPGIRCFGRDVYGAGAS